MAVSRGLDFTFEAFGEAQVVRRIERLELQGQDLSPAFEEIEKSFLAFERKQFATEGRAGSGGWAPLKERTKRYKANHKPPLSPKILQATQKLRKSLTNKSSGDHFVEIKRDEWKSGSTVRYGRFHQKGNARLPRRRPIELTESIRRAWVRIIQKKLVEH